VESIVKKVAELAERKTGTATDIEQEVWTGSLQLARAVMSLFFAQRAAQPCPVGYEHEGRHFELAGRQTTEIGTRFGKVQVLQPIRECTDAAARTRELPLMRELGLPAGFTPPVVTLFGRH